VRFKKEIKVFLEKPLCITIISQLSVQKFTVKDEIIFVATNVQVSAKLRLDNIIDDMLRDTRSVCWHINNNKRKISSFIINLGTES